MKKRFFNLAKKLSQKSDYQAHKLGAVIVRGGEVVGIGFNKRKTHPLSKTRFNNIHAELSAVLNSGLENLQGCHVYVYRETKQGQIAMARPCGHCMDILKKLSVRRVYYSTPNGFQKERV